MTRFLRTASTRRLVATISGVIVAIALGTAIAVAAAGSGPVPRKTSLARAVHTALAAKAVQGISGRISFTNHLINASDFQGNVDPILSGASGRFWLSKDHLRLELQSDNGDAQVIVNNGSFWISDPSSNTVYEGTLPSHGKLKDRAVAAIQMSLSPIWRPPVLSSRAMREAVQAIFSSISITVKRFKPF